MEDMTTYSASWLRAWGWRRLMWRMPSWKETRYYFEVNHPASLIVKCTSHKSKADDLILVILWLWLCIKPVD